MPRRKVEVLYNAGDRWWHYEDCPWLQDGECNCPNEPKPRFSIVGFLKDLWRSM